MTPDCNMCDLHPQLTFNKLFDNVTCNCGMWQNCLYSVPWSLGPNFITTGINVTYDLISPFTVLLFNINGSRSNMRAHIFKCVQNSWPVTTSTGKMEQKEIWYPNKNGLIWLGTYWVTPSYDPKLWHVSPLPTIHSQLTFLPIWLVSAKMEQKEIWYPNKNGLIWLGTCWVTPSYDPKLWHVSPLPTIHPRLTFLPIWLVSAACHKIAHIVSPNHLGQISLPRASMSLMTSFHNSQFHCSISMEVGQILWSTFSNVSKNHDPSPLWVQKWNRGKYDTQTKMVSYDLGHTG